MAAPLLVSSSPTNGQTAVKKNASITLLFDTALDPTTVTGATVVLFNSALNERVPAQVAVSSDGLTVAITPTNHLYPDTGYRIRIVGANVDAACVKSLTADSLALTITIVFQTGDTLETGSTTTEPEGDIDLPSDVTLVGGVGGPLRLEATDPGHQSFGISPAVSQISFRFSASVDPASVTGAVTVRQTAFYDESDFLSRETDLGGDDGLRHYFAAETGYYTGDAPNYLDPELFRERDYELTIDDDTVTVVFEEGYEFPKNTAIEITLGATLADTDGNPLSEELVWFGCVESYPSWASLMAVRHQAGFEVAATFPDSYVGLRTWMSTIDMLGEFNWTLPTDKPSRYAMEYVRTRSALEIWHSLLEDKGINAGTSKRLGDFEITVNTAAGSARPSKMRLLEERLEELDRVLWGGMTQTPRVGIRSSLDPYEPGRGYFRDRLWRAEIMRNRGVYSTAPAANTAQERSQVGSLSVSWQSGGTPFPGGPGARHQL